MFKFYYINSSNKIDFSSLSYFEHARHNKMKILIQWIFRVCLYSFTFNTLSAETKKHQKQEVLCNIREVTENVISGRPFPFPIKSFILVECDENKSFSMTIDDFGKNVNELYEFHVIYKNSSKKSIQEIFNKKYRKDSQLNGMFITNSELKFFPYGLTEIIHEMGFLKISQCGLLILDKQNLKEFGNFVYSFDFSHNFLTTLDAELFIYNTKLVLVDFSGNFLKHVQIFSKFSIIYADFRSNDCFQARGEFTIDQNSSETDKIIKRNPKSNWTCHGDVLKYNNYTLIKTALSRPNSKIQLTCRIFAETKKNVFKCYNVFVKNPKTSVVSARFSNETRIEANDHKENGLKIRDELIEFIPKNITSIFKNLKYLSIINSKLSYVSKHDLKQFGNELKNFNFIKNNLFYIEKDLFIFNNNLEVIDLSENHLQFIDASFFDYAETSPSLILVFADRAGCLDTFKSRIGDKSINFDLNSIEKCTPQNYNFKSYENNEKNLEWIPLQPHDIIDETTDETTDEINDETTDETTDKTKDKTTDETTGETTGETIEKTIDDIDEIDFEIIGNLTWIYGFFFILLTCLLFFSVYNSFKAKREVMRIRKKYDETFKLGNGKIIDMETEIVGKSECFPYDEKYEIKTECLKLKETFGSGSYGIVRRAIWKNDLTNEVGQDVAAKTAIRNNIATIALGDEIKIMIYVQENIGRHENVVQLLGAVTQNLYKNELIMVMEFCKFGSLKSFIASNSENFINQLNCNGEIDPNITELERGQKQIFIPN